MKPRFLARRAEARTLKRLQKVVTDSAAVGADYRSRMKLAPDVDLYIYPPAWLVEGHREWLEKALLPHHLVLRESDTPSTAGGPNDV